MTLYKRGKIWWVEYWVDKVRYRQSTHTTQYNVAKAWTSQIKVARKMPTFEEAVEVLKMFYKKPVDGLLPIESTWGVYLDLAKATGKTAIEPATLTRRENVIKRFLDWLTKNRATVRTIEGVTGPIAAAFASHLAEKGLKTKTRINVIADLNTVWKLLENASTGVRNPWPSLRPQDTDGECGKAFTPDDERRVLEAAQRVGKQWFEVSTIMRHTGIRYGDVARLKWSDISGDVIRLTPNKTKRKKIAVAIPIITEVSDVIRDLPRTGDYLFPLHAELYGDRGRASRAILSFREVLTAAGLADAGYTVHSWRHTAATRLADAGADIETRKRVLGHREDATAERYDHAEHIDETRRALEAAASCHSKIGKS